MKTVLLIASSLLCYMASAQTKAVQLCNETFKLNSQSRVLGEQSNAIPLEIPANTTQIIYSITTTSDGSTTQAINLTAKVAAIVLENPGISNVGLLVSKLTGSDNPYPVNTYIIANREQVTNFLNGNRFYSIETGCRTNLVQGIVGFSYPAEINQLLYLCINNPNSFEGIQVHAEATAIVSNERISGLPSTWDRDTKDKVFNALDSMIFEQSKAFELQEGDRYRMKLVAGCCTDKLVKEYTPQQFYELANYEQEIFIAKSIEDCIKDFKDKEQNKK